MIELKHKAFDFTNLNKNSGFDFSIIANNKKDIPTFIEKGQPYVQARLQQIFELIKSKETLQNQYQYDHKNLFYVKDDKQLIIIYIKNSNQLKGLFIYKGYSTLSQEALTSLPNLLATPEGREELQNTINHEKLTLNTIPYAFLVMTITENSFKNINITTYNPIEGSGIQTHLIYNIRPYLNTIATIKQELNITTDTLTLSEFIPNKNTTQFNIAGISCQPPAAFYYRLTFPWPTQDNFKLLPKHIKIDNETKTIIRHSSTTPFTFPYYLQLDNMHFDNYQTLAQYILYMKKNIPTLELPETTAKKTGVFDDEHPTMLLINSIGSGPRKSNKTGATVTALKNLTTNQLKQIIPLLQNETPDTILDTIKNFKKS